MNRSINLYLLMISSDFTNFTKLKNKIDDYYRHIHEYYMHCGLMSIAYLFVSTRNLISIIFQVFIKRNKNENKYIREKYI